MMRTESHERPNTTQTSTRRVRGIGVYLAIPTVLGIAAGAWIGSQIFEDSRKMEASIQGQSAAVARDVDALARAIGKRIDDLRTQAIQTKLKKNLAAPFELWVEFDILDGEIGQVLSSKRRETSELSANLAKAENDLIWSAAKQLPLAKLREQGSIIIKPEGLSALQSGLLGFAFYRDDPQSSSAIVTWMKPQNAFPELQGQTSGEEPMTGKSVSLVNEEGRVIAHTNPAMVGLDLSKSTFFQRYGRKTLRGAQSAAETIDSERNNESEAPTKIGYRKLDTQPFLLVMEVSALVAPQGFLGSSLRIADWNRALLVLIGVIIFGAFAAWSLERKIRGARNKVRDAGLDSTPPALPPLPKLDLTKTLTHAAMPPAPPPPPQARREMGTNTAIELVSRVQNEQQSARSEAAQAANSMIVAEAQSVEAAIDETRTGLAQTPTPRTAVKPAPRRRYDTAQAGRELVQQLEARLTQFADPRELTHHMAETAALLTESPTLFFVYHAGVKAALLQTACGFPKGQAPKGMSFAIPHESYDAILKTAIQSKIPSLSNFEPLSKLILARLGIAHFEAWGVTNPEHGKLIGILVILQAGLQSAMHQQSMARLMKSVGEALNDAPGL